MKHKELDKQLREFEYFHDIKILPNTYPIIRVDGRGFTKLSNKHFPRPFDTKFHEMMLETTKALLKEFGGLYAFTESDEISILLPKNTDLFDRSLEKLVSTSAALASSTFSLQLKSTACFDSRVCVLPTQDDVVAYFRWRQNDTHRCCLNGWCHWKLIAEGKSPAAAASYLKKQTFDFKTQYLSTQGIDYENLPAWQRNGSGLYYGIEEREGYNPITNTFIKVERRKILINENLPSGKEYGEFVRSKII